MNRLPLQPARISLFSLLALCVGTGAVLLAGGCASSSKTTTNSSSPAVPVKSTEVEKKDLSVLNPGTPRATVIDELGAPATTSKSRTGQTVDVFTFVQGTAESSKTPRPVEAENAEATELMALFGQTGFSPTGMLNGKKISVQVNYDEALLVTSTVVLRIQ